MPKVSTFIEVQRATTEKGSATKRHKVTKGLSDFFCAFCAFLWLCNEHAVAIAVEAISYYDSVIIGRQNGFARCERRYKHDQRGFRQVEVGEHRADGFEFVSGQYKDAGFTGCLDKSPVPPD